MGVLGDLFAAEIDLAGSVDRVTFSTNSRADVVILVSIN